MKHIPTYIDKLKLEVQFIVGENAKDNFAVIDTGCPEDYWFHVQNESSCHVLAIVPDGLDRKKRGYIIRKGAELCKRFSKCRSQGKVEIVYTKIKYVVKTDVAGKVCISEQNSICI